SCLHHILHAFPTLRSSDLVTHEDVLKLHRIMAGGVMDQGMAGRYRKIRVRVGDYIAPPPEKLQPMMSDLLGWWNKRAARISSILDRKSTRLNSSHRTI